MLLPYTLWSLPFGALIQDWEKLASIRVSVLVEFNITNSLREHCLLCGLMVRIRRSHGRGWGTIQSTGMSYWHNNVTTFQWMQWKRKIAKFLSLQSRHRSAIFLQVQQNIILLTHYSTSNSYHLYQIKTNPLLDCIGGSVVEFSPATRETGVRFPANALVFGQG